MKPRRLSFPTAGTTVARVVTPLRANADGGVERHFVVAAGFDTLCWVLWKWRFSLMFSMGFRRYDHAGRVAAGRHVAGRRIDGEACVGDPRASLDTGGLIFHIAEYAGEQHEF